MSDSPPNLPRPVRRAPNIVAFLVSGTVIGIVVGALVGLQATSDNYTQISAIGLMAVIGAVVGAIVAGVAVALIEYRALR